MKRTIFIIVSFLFIVTNQFAQVASSDEDQIRELIKKFSLMWTDKNGIQIANEITSNNFVFITNQRSFRKEEYLQFLSSLLSTNQPQKHTHEIIEIVIRDKLAYEYGRMEITMKNGSIQKNETFNVFTKDNMDWKLVSNLPVEMMKLIFQK